MDMKAICEASGVCVGVVAGTVSGSTIASIVMGLPAFTWFGWQLLDKWRAKRAEKASRSTGESG